MLLCLVRYPPKRGFVAADGWQQHAVTAAVVQTPRSSARTGTELFSKTHLVCSLVLGVLGLAGG